MKLLEITDWKRRPLLYSFVLIIGILISEYVYDNSEPIFYLYSLITISLILCLELAMTIYYGKLHLIQYKLPPLNNSHLIANLISHIILPISLLIATFTFYFFHKYSLVKYIFVIIVFFLFFVLFTNIKAFYEDKFKIEIETHYVYDIITLISYLGLLDGLLNWAEYFSLEANFRYLTLLIVTTIYLIMIIVRLGVYDLYKAIVPLLILHLGLTLLLFEIRIQNIKIAFLNLLLFFIFLAYSHHHKENTKTLKVIEEYIVFILIAVILLIFN